VIVDGVPRHASQLYEALLEGLALFLIMWWFTSRPRPRWAPSGLFLLCYGLFRFGVEFVRVPDENRGYLLLGWVTMGQLLSLPMIVAGLWMLAVAYRRREPSGNHT
jgi:phosphatidylglycerol:prolipoprotein diacylglycerol transferase